MFITTQCVPPPRLSSRFITLSYPLLITYLISKKYTHKMIYSHSLYSVNYSIIGQCFILKLAPTEGLRSVASFFRHQQSFSFGCLFFAFIKTSSHGTCLTRLTTNEWWWCLRIHSFGQLTINGGGLCGTNDSFYFVTCMPLPSDFGGGRGGSGWYLLQTRIPLPVNVFNNNEKPIIASNIPRNPLVCFVVGLIIRGLANVIAFSKLGILSFKLNWLFQK